MDQDSGSDPPRPIPGRWQSPTIPAGKLEFASWLQQTLRDLHDPSSIEHEVCQRLTIELQVDRTTYLEIDESQRQIRVSHTAVRNGASPDTGTYNTDDFFWAVNAMKDGQCLRIDDTQDSPFIPSAFRSHCAAIDLIATIGAPVHRGGRLVGALCVSVPAPRNWLDDELELLRYAAEQMWSTLVTVRTEVRLRERGAQLEEHTHRLRVLASQLTLTEHRTREQISRVLHDDVQQQLFAVQMKMNQLCERLPGEALLISARDELGQAIESTRRLSSDLFPPVLHNDRLPDALDWIAAWARSRYGMEVDVVAHSDADPDELDTRILLFECIRELVFNAVKHAGVRRIQINLTIEPQGFIKAVVADLGAGFDASSLLHPSGRATGFGLLSVGERLKLLGGTMNIQSEPGQGASITLLAPRVTADHPPNTRGLHHTPSHPAGALHPIAASRAKQMGQKRMRVLIADDHAMCRDGLRQLLSEQPELEVIGEVIDGGDAVDKALALLPDAIIMDLKMPVLDGAEATRRIKKMLPQVLVFTLSAQEWADDRSMQAVGASAHFSKVDGANLLVQRLLEESGHGPMVAGAGFKGRAAKVRNDVPPATWWLHDPSSGPRNNKAQPWRLG